MLFREWTLRKIELVISMLSWENYGICFQTLSLFLVFFFFFHLIILNKYWLRLRTTLIILAPEGWKYCPPLCQAIFHPSGAIIINVAFNPSQYLNIKHNILKWKHIFLLFMSLDSWNIRGWYIKIINFVGLILYRKETLRTYEHVN